MRNHWLVCVLMTAALLPGAAPGVEVDFSRLTEAIGATGMTGNLGIADPAAVSIQGGTLALSPGTDLSRDTETLLYTSPTDLGDEWTLETQINFRSYARPQQAGLFVGSREKHVRLVIGVLPPWGAAPQVGMYGLDEREQKWDGQYTAGSWAWLRLVKRAGLLWGYVSSDGRNFSLVGTLRPPDVEGPLTAGVCFLDVSPGRTTPRTRGIVARCRNFRATAGYAADMFSAQPRLFVKVKLLSVTPSDRPVKLGGTFYGNIEQRLFRFALLRDGTVPQFHTSWHLPLPWDKIPEAQGLRPGESTEWSDWSGMLIGTQPQMTLGLALWEDGLPRIAEAKGDGGNVKSYQIEVSLASAPADQAILRKINYQADHHTFGLWFPEVPLSAKTGASRILTLREYAQARLDTYRSRGATDCPQPAELIITADSHRGYHNKLYDPATDALEDQIQQLLGVNRKQIEIGDPLRSYKADLYSADLTNVFAGSLAALNKQVPDGPFCVKVGDEMAPLSVAELRGSATGLAAFRAWLQTRVASPADLGLTSFDQAQPLDQADVKRADQARLRYLTAWFLQERTALVYHHFTEACHLVWGDRAVTGTDVYYAAFPAKEDYFIESRLGAFDQQMHHFGSGDDAGIGASQTNTDLFLGDLLRSASQFGSMKTGMLWYPSRIAQGEGTLLSGLTALAHGIQRIHYYGYGPMYSGWEYFSDDRYKVDAFLSASRISQMASRYEKYLLHGRRPSAQVAVLLSRSAPLWAKTSAQDLVSTFGWAAPNTDGAKSALALCGAGGPQGWGVERRMLHSALQWANLPTDILPEEEVESGRLNAYKVLYVYEPNVSAKAQQQIAQWVRDGGSLYLGPGAATRDEVNAPCNLLTTLTGRSDIVSLSSAQLADPKTWQTGATYTEKDLATLGSGETVTVSAPIRGMSFSFTALGRRESLAADGMAVLGRWQDGTAALVAIPVGQGRVLKSGVSLGASYARTADPAMLASRPGVKAPPYSYMSGIGSYWQRTLDADLQSLITLPTRFAAEEPAVQPALSGIDSGLYEMPDGSGALLLLGSYTTADTSALPVRVTLSRPYSKVTTFSRRPILPAWQGNVATLAVGLDVIEAVEFTP